MNKETAIYGIATGIVCSAMPGRSGFDKPGKIGKAEPDTERPSIFTALSDSCLASGFYGIGANRRKIS